MALNPGPRRGEPVTVAISGDYGKPRPALVIQSDAFAQLPSVTVLRITSELHEWPLLRITVPPTEAPIGDFGPPPLDSRCSRRK